MARHLYASSPVVDGLPLLAEPEFWAAHLIDLYDDALVESFGVDPADVEGMLERLCDKAAWPMFRIPLAGGHSVLVHYNTVRSTPPPTTSSSTLTGGRMTWSSPVPTRIASAPACVGPSSLLSLTPQGTEKE
ncbi:hypothetical protein [Streptomyces sp. NPDC001312]|uniref:hypothetical protein n=1 Tax=Streptomyces sp. NPDC001312 TaxID=3364561 RepID=UPI0036BB3D03